MVGERDGVESNRANGQVRGLHTLELLPSFGASEKNKIKQNKKKKAAEATRGGKYLSVRYLPLPDTRQAYAPTDSFQYSDYTDQITQISSFVIIICRTEVTRLSSIVLWVRLRYTLLRTKRNWTVLIQC